MPEVMTSIRIDEQVLADLRLIASANGTSVAAEIRRAIAQLVVSTTKSPDFNERLLKQAEENQKRVESLLALANR